MEAVINFIFLDSKITVDGDNSHEIKRCLLLRRKIMTNLDGETVETVSDFIFLGSKITADGDCSHEIKRHLLLGRNAMTNLDRILESRDITLPTEVRVLKLLFFQ